MRSALNIGTVELRLAYVTRQAGISYGRQVRQRIPDSDCHWSHEMTNSTDLRNRYRYYLRDLRRCLS
jgi:hypothetical protein